jgi:hypothetical protein
MFTCGDFIDYHLIFLTEAYIFLKYVTADVVPLVLQFWPF